MMSIEQRLYVIEALLPQVFRFLGRADPEIPGERLAAAVERLVEGVRRGDIAEQAGAMSTLAQLVKERSRTS